MEQNAVDSNLVRCSRIGFIELNHDEIDRVLILGEQVRIDVGSIVREVTVPQLRWMSQVDQA